MSGLIVYSHDGHGTRHPLVLFNDPNLISVAVVLHKLCEGYGDIGFERVIKPICLCIQYTVQHNDGTDITRKQMIANNDAACGIGSHVVRFPQAVSVDDIGMGRLH